MRIPIDTDFADLSQPQKDAVLTWANSHNWGETKAHWGVNDPDQLVCYFSEVRDDSDWKDYAMSFSTLRALRDEAGY